MNSRLLYFFFKFNKSFLPLFIRFCVRLIRLSLTFDTKVILIQPSVFYESPFISPPNNLEREYDSSSLVKTPHNRYIFSHDQGFQRLSIYCTRSKRTLVQLLYRCVHVIFLWFTTVSM